MHINICVNGRVVERIDVPEHETVEDMLAWLRATTDIQFRVYTDTVLSRTENMK